MRTIFRKYGLPAAAAALLLFLLSFALGKGTSYGTQEILGYLSIVLSLLLVFFAVRHYRDQVNGGRLSFRKGLVVGLLVTVCVGIGAAVADVIYTTLLYPDFVTDYTAYQLEQLRAVTPPADYPAAERALREQVAAVGHPAIMAVVMFFTVLLIGFIISSLSALTLRTAPSV